MIRGLKSPRTPRDTLFALAACFGACTALWVSVGVVDLHDGRTWNERRSHGAGRGWYMIDSAENPSVFRFTIMTRYVLPLTLVGTITVVCLLCGLSQPKRDAE